MNTDLNEIVARLLDEVTFDNGRPVLPAKACTWATRSIAQASSDEQREIGVHLIRVTREWSRPSSGGSLHGPMSWV